MGVSQDTAPALFPYWTGSHEVCELKDFHLELIPAHVRCVTNNNPSMTSIEQHLKTCDLQNLRKRSNKWSNHAQNLQHGTNSKAGLPKQQGLLSSVIKQFGRVETTPTKALNCKLIAVLTANLDFPVKESGIPHQILGFLACFLTNECACVRNTLAQTHDRCIVLSDQPKESAGIHV